MATIEVKTQQELTEAFKKAGSLDIIACVGSGYFEVGTAAAGSAKVGAYGSAQVRAYNSAQVRAYDSAQVTAYNSAQVRAYDSAQVTASGSARVTAYGSAQVRASGSAQVTAYGSAQVRAYDSAQVTAYDSARVRASGSAQVRAYGSAQVTASDSVQVTASGSAQVRASGSAQVTAYDSVQVRAAKYVAVTRHAKTVKVSGGVLIELPQITTATEWCDLYGVAVKRGIATLFKAVDDDYATESSRRRGIAYTPGTTPAAPDWDPAPECGGGLHFSPRPAAALRFNPNATRYVACPVKLEDIVVHKDAEFPDKVKAPRVHGPTYEVDIDGDPIAETKTTMAA